MRVSEKRGPGYGGLGRRVRDRSGASGEEPEAAQGPTKVGLCWTAHSLCLDTFGVARVVEHAPKLGLDLG